MEGGGRFHGHGTSSNTNSDSSAPGLKQTEPKMKMKQVENNNGKGSDEKESLVREQDRFVPVANVIRIMRRMLPAHAKISDDSKEAMQECVSEFIMFVTLEANDKCKREQRKTVTAEDVLWALGTLGLDSYVEPLSLFLRRYRETEWDRTSVRGEPLFKIPSSTAVDLGATSSSGPVMTPSLPIDNMDPLWFLGEAAVGDYIIDADANIGQPKGHYYK